MGIWFLVIMVGFVGVVIFYDMFNVLYYFFEDCYVVVVFELFVFVVLMFWYVFCIFMSCD